MPLKYPDVPSLLDSATQARVAAICDRHLTRAALAPLIEISGFLETGKLFPAHGDWDRRKAVEDHIARLTQGLMEEMRAEGLLSPCPNNGPRDVAGITSWNAWLAGDLDPGDARARIDLERSPAFSVLSGKIVRASVEITRPRDAGDAGLDAATRAIDSAIESARSTFIAGHDPFGLRPGMQCRVTGEHLHLTGSFYAPVLGRYEAGRMDPVPVPPIEAPKPVLHLEIALPSGRLAMADWFRAPGFKEGLETLCAEPAGGYEINSQAGLDARMRDYFEQAGIVIVQVGNSSPAAYPDRDGLWRMGRVDEDDERFWDEDGAPIGGGSPKPAWRTCTDLWANTFAAPERIVEVMMASGLHADRSAAEAALTRYCEETYGAEIVDLGIDRLHVYAPTGYGVHADAFAAAFEAAEIERRDWQEDAYVLSAKPLSVSPDILLEHHWVEPEWPGVTADGPEGMAP